jgi:hypothetical protein
MVTMQDIIKNNITPNQIPAHIYGGAPSVKVSKNFDFNCIKIAVGDMGWRAPNLGPYQYWFTNNTYFPLPWKKKDLNKILNSNAITFISSSSVNGIKSSENIENVFNNINQIINNKIVLYDASHFSGQKCNPINNCCKFIDNFRINSTPQEELSKIVNKSKPAYQIGHTVLNSLALAILLNCNPILISGVEFPEVTRNYKYYKNWKNTSGIKLRIIGLMRQYMPIYNREKTDFAGEFRIKILKDFEEIGLIAKKLNIQIFSTSKTSPINNLSGYSYIPS